MFIVTTNVIFLEFVAWTAMVIVQQYEKQNILMCIIYQIKYKNIRNMNIAVVSMALTMLSSLCISGSIFDGNNLGNFVKFA